MGSFWTLFWSHFGSVSEAIWRRMLPKRPLRAHLVFGSRFGPKTAPKQGGGLLLGSRVWRAKSMVWGPWQCPFRTPINNPCLLLEFQNQTSPSFEKTPLRVLLVPACIVKHSHGLQTLLQIKKREAAVASPHGVLDYSFSAVLQEHSRSGQELCQ